MARYGFGSSVIPIKMRKVSRNHMSRMTISYLMIFSYSLSLPLESRQRLYITDASTLAGLYVLGSFNNEITDSRIVLRCKKHNQLIINFNRNFNSCFPQLQHRVVQFCLKINRFQFQVLKIIASSRTIATFIYFSLLCSFLSDSLIWRYCIYLTFCVGFHLSQGNSPLCGSSTGGCRIDMQRSPFYTEKEVAF